MTEQTITAARIADSAAYLSAQEQSPGTIKVNSPESVKTIGVFAFKNCVGLEEINLSHAETISECAFERTAIRAADLTNVKTIGKLAARLSTTAPHWKL